MLLVAGVWFWLLLFLPVWGLPLVVGIAGPLHGVTQRLVLLSGTALLAVVSWAVGPSLHGREGDWLGNLFIRGVYWCGLSVALVFLIGVAVTTAGWLLRGGDAAPEGTPSQEPSTGGVAPGEDGASPGEAMARAFAPRR